MIERLSPQATETLKYDWPLWIARENQLPPEWDFRVWLCMTGRAWGKTRTGGETIRHWIESGKSRRIALIARTSADVRDTIVKGEAGILTISPPWNRPLWEPSKRRLTWPNGAHATTYSGDEPDQLRGPEHDTVWADELASWKYADDAWANAMLGLRIGHAKAIVTTTPKPIDLLRELMNDPGTHVTRGTTYDNRANLAQAFFKGIVGRYEGTSRGRQELEGELLEESEGALLERKDFESTRTEAPTEWKRGVVAIDPAATSTQKSDETGIVVTVRGYDDHAYTLEDLSGRYTPEAWARKAIDAYRRHGLDRIVAEKNNGGEMVEHTLRTVDRAVPVKLVHASQGKRARAEPVSVLFTRGHAHHCGKFPQLEDQWCTWEPLSGMRSPDRLDAETWAVTELFPELHKGGVSWADLYPDARAEHADAA